jgi:hypothetical protein
MRERRLSIIATKLLIRVSQVRDLHGLLTSEDRPSWRFFRRIGVSKYWVYRHPDSIYFWENINLLVSLG